MDTIGYLSQNGLCHYPFKDSCSLQFGNFFIPDDAFLDIIFVSKVATGRRAYLSHFSKGASSFTLSFFDPDRFVTWGTMTIPFTSIVPYDFVSADLTACSIKIVTGAGFTRLMALPNFSYNFSSQVAELNASAFIQRTPVVSSLVVQNLDASVHTFTGDCTLSAGTNLFLTSDAGLGLNVKAGAGQGKYDPCGTIDGIRLLNGVAPSQDGAFTLAFPPCYTWTDGTNALSLANTCVAPCNPEAMGAVAHYENRLCDAMLQLNSYLATVQQSTKTAVEGILQQLSNTMYYKWQYVVTTKPGTERMYVSVNVIIYNPSSLPATASLVLTTNMSTVSASESLSFTLPCYGHAVYKYVGTTTGPLATMSVEGLWSIDSGLYAGNFILESFSLENPAFPAQSSSSGTYVWF